MKKGSKHEGIAYLLIGLCFFIAAIIRRNNRIVSIACFFVILGATKTKRKDKPNNLKHK